MIMKFLNKNNKKRFPAQFYLRLLLFYQLNYNKKQKVVNIRYENKIESNVFKNTLTKKIM